MKRITVTVDEALLEDAHRTTGEKTISATVNKALAEIGRGTRLRKALDKLAELAKSGPIFADGYLEQIRPNAYSVTDKKRSAAHERRAPRKKNRSRDSR
ncbi:MAG: hypothetical protein QOH21_3411 [Acidobacteriota bacterium]|jgi:hypothetical protein|nr:hypothetical protein [Acidobacteriota bacterium]